MWYAPSAFNFIENQTLLQVFLTLCNEANGPRSQRTQHIKKHVLKLRIKNKFETIAMQWFCCTQTSFCAGIQIWHYWRYFVLKETSAPITILMGIFFFLWLFVLRCTSRPNFITFLQRLGLFFFVEQLHH